MFTPVISVELFFLEMVWDEYEWRTLRQEKELLHLLIHGPRRDVKAGESGQPFVILEFQLVERLTPVDIVLFHFV